MQFIAPSQTLSELVTLAGQTSTSDRAIKAEGRQVDPEDDTHTIPAGEFVEEALLVELALGWGLGKGEPVTLKLYETNPERTDEDFGHGWRYLKSSKVKPGNVSGAWTEGQDLSTAERFFANLYQDPQGNKDKLDIIAPMLSGLMEHCAKGVGAFVREIRAGVQATPLPARTVYVQPFPYAGSAGRMLPAPEPVPVQAVPSAA